MTTSTRPGSAAEVFLDQDDEAITDDLIDADDTAAPKRAGSNVESEGEDVVYSRLSSRQQEVLKLVADGFTSREIAVKLGIAYKTVDAHRQHIVKRLAAKSVADLVKHAVRSGLTDLTTR